DAIRDSVVTYYVTLYNNGPTKLYLTELQDRLPAGFTLYGISLHGAYNDPACTNRDGTVANGYSWNQRTTAKPLARIDEVDEANYKRVIVEGVADPTTGMVHFTFERDANCDISYDENRQMCYLNP